MGKGNMCLNGYVRMCCPKNWGMEFMDFEWLLRTDPKTTEEHIGDCCYWIRKMCAKGKLNLMDLDVLRTALLLYYEHNGLCFDERIGMWCHVDINDFYDLSQLCDYLSQYSDVFKPVNYPHLKEGDFLPAKLKENNDEELEKAYEDKDWIVYIPHTFQALREIGRNTHWHAASLANDSVFNFYNNQGLLHINVRKSDNAKFLFHFETDLFGDSNGSDHINISKIGISNGASAFYQKIDKLFGLRCKYDCVGVLRNGVAMVLDHTIGKCNFADKNGVLLLSDNWIKYFDNPSKKYKIAFDGKEAYINSRGELFDSNE